MNFLCIRLRRIAHTWREINENTLYSFSNSLALTLTPVLTLVRAFMIPADLAEKGADLAEAQFETARSVFHLRNLRATGILFIE